MASPDLWMALIWNKCSHPVCPWSQCCIMYLGVSQVHRNDQGNDRTDIPFHKLLSHPFKLSCLLYLETAGNITLPAHLFSMGVEKQDPVLQLGPCSISIAYALRAQAGGPPSQQLCFCADLMLCRPLPGRRLATPMRVLIQLLLNFTCIPWRQVWWACMPPPTLQSHSALCDWDIPMMAWPFTAHCWESAMQQLLTSLDLYFLCCSIVSLKRWLWISLPCGLFDPLWGRFP